MKKFLLFLVVLITFLPSLVKAQEPYWEYSGLKDKRLLALITNDDGTAFAGTQFGIYSSYNHGKTWELCGAPTSTIISLGINNKGHTLCWSN